MNIASFQLGFEVWVSGSFPMPLLPQLPPNSLLEDMKCGGELAGCDV